MAVTSAKIRAREKETGKTAYTAVDSKGNIHYAFDNLTLDSIIAKAENSYIDASSAKSYDAALKQADYNNSFNAEQAQKQMDFQERLSNTSHQREVEDLKKAGLNPVLSANNGASTASGSSASADTSATTAKVALAQAKIQQQNARYQAQLNAATALETNRQNIASAQKMARWTNALNKELGYAGLNNQKDIANISAAASMYGADTSASASRYAVDNPNNPWMYLIKSVLGDTNSGSSLLSKLGSSLNKGVSSFSSKLSGNAKASLKSGKYGSSSK